MPQRTLDHYVRVYEEDLEPALCQRLIAAFSEFSSRIQPNGRGHHPALSDSGWTELNLSRIADSSTIDYFAHKCGQALARYNRDVRLPLQVPDSLRRSDLILKRYRPGGADRFQLHFDSLNEVCNRYLVLLWYLNDVAEGGETVFPDLDLSQSPRRGRLLMFPPYWMYQHAGRPPRSGEKYILSTYYLF